MVCKDIDGNEIKAGDTVECVTASQFDALTGAHGRVGRRYKVTHVDGPGSVGLKGISASIPTRFRKVAQPCVVEALAAANARADRAVRDFDYAACEAARLAQRVRDLEVQLAGETKLRMDAVASLGALHVDLEKRLADAIKNRDTLAKDLTKAYVEMHNKNTGIKKLVDSLKGLL